MKEGALVAAIVDDPRGGGSVWDSKKAEWIYKPVLRGQPLVFQRVIPKVRIVKHGEWNDGLDEMLLCKKQDGEQAWLNIGNAKEVAK